MDIGNLYQLFLEAKNVTTDSRNIDAGSLFFALKGEKFNGNAFAEEALKKGAKWAVIDEPGYAGHANTILVDNVLHTLQQLATHHREQLQIPVIGLTGSNGKTTSKELISSVLSTRFRTKATRGNLNNHIGVPLTILAITHDDEMAVVEMGANRVGDIALLCSIARPTHGVITNIGKAHIGTFGGFQNIVKGKTELYDFLAANNGTVFINSQNDILKSRGHIFKDPVYYPASGDFFHAELIEATPFVKMRVESGEVIETQLLGSYNFENIALALCIGKYFKVDPHAAHRAVQTYQPQNMRSQIVKKDTNTIILDAYNANPTSMEAAVKNLAEMKAARKVLILGDMLELEEESEKEHREIGRLIQELAFKEVYFCGALMKVAQLEVPSSRHFATKDDLLEVLRQNKFENAAILIKASRSLGLETILDEI